MGRHKRVVINRGAYPNKTALVLRSRPNLFRAQGSCGVPRIHRDRRLFATCLHGPVRARPTSQRIYPSEEVCQQRGFLAVGHPATECEFVLLNRARLRSAENVMCRGIVAKSTSTASTPA